LNRDSPFESRDYFLLGPPRLRLLATSLVVVISTALVASYTIKGFFRFTVALVLTDITFVLAAIPFILSLVRPTTFVASVLTIIIICKLQVLLGIGHRSPEGICITSGMACFWINANSIPDVIALIGFILFLPIFCFLLEQGPEVKERSRPKCTAV
jgi:hypothetical protein